MVMREAAESVRLKAAMCCLNDSAAEKRTPRSVPFGGFSSAVTVTALRSSDSERRLTGQRGPSTAEGERPPPW